MAIGEGTISQHHSFSGKSQLTFGCGQTMAENKTSKEGSCAPKNSGKSNGGCSKFRLSRPIDPAVELKVIKARQAYDLLCSPSKKLTPSEPNEKPCVDQEKDSSPKKNCAKSRFRLSNPIDRAMEINVIKARQAYKDLSESPNVKKRAMEADQNSRPMNGDENESSLVSKFDGQLQDNFIGFGASQEEILPDSNSDEPTPASSRDKSSAITPFDRETTVFENESLKIYIFRKDFERQKKFSFDDHLFLLKIETLEGKPPLLLQIEDILMRACEEILEKIKIFYVRGNLKEIFFYVFMKGCNIMLNETIYR